MFLFNCQFNVFTVLVSRVARSLRGLGKGSFRYVFINKLQVLALEELPLFFSIITQVIAGKQGIPINVTELSDYAVVVALVVEVLSCCGCSNIFVAAHSEVEDAVVAESQWCLTSQVLYFFFMSGEHQIQDVWSLVTTTTSGYLDLLNQKVIFHSFKESRCYTTSPSTCLFQFPISVWEIKIAENQYIGEWGVVSIVNEAHQVIVVYISAVRTSVNTANQHLVLAAATHRNGNPDRLVEFLT